MGERIENGAAAAVYRADIARCAPPEWHKREADAEERGDRTASIPLDEI